MRTLGETLLESSPWQVKDLDDDSGPVSFHQHLADSAAARHFKCLNTAALDSLTQIPDKFAAADRDSITELERARWSSIFETLKWGGGIYAAHRWAPEFVPPLPAPAGLLDWSRNAKIDRIVFGGPTKSEILKQMKARYTVTCMGGMVAGWTASHLADQLFFPRDQHMEGAIAGDLTGIAMALIIPGWKQKAALVTASHLVGKSLDHWRQPNIAVKQRRY
jgi:hypothetical protein